MVRQSSPVGDGWKIVTLITPDVVCGYTDYSCQPQVKLGSIYFTKTSGDIPFDRKNSVSSLCAASHSMAKLTWEWILRQGRPEVGS